MKALALLSRPDHLNALAHPLRVRALEVLRAPASAAALARALGETRQKMTYHLRQLQRAGLIRKVAERRTGGFVEDLYQAAASAFVVSPQVTWGGRARLAALRDQLPLQALVRLGERLQRDAAVLLDQAAFEGARVASVCLESELRLASEEDRANFMKDYFAAVRPLLERYGAGKGKRYRLVMAVHPDPQKRESKP